MKSHLLALLMIVPLAGFAQPNGYVEGDLTCGTINTRTYLYFRSPGWTQANGHTMIFFTGSAQKNCATGDDMQPGGILQSVANGGSNWNGVVPMPDGSTRKMEVIFILNAGCQGNLYLADIAAILSNPAVRRDTALHSRYHLAGGSLGPGNAICWLKITNNNPWRYIFSTSIFMSCSSIFADASWPIPKNLVWYGTADVNPGTEPLRSIQWYNSLTGVAGVDKALKFTARQGHNNGTWGDCFKTSGTDSSTNLWIKQIMWGESLMPANSLPVANAGTDKVITAPANSITLIGGATDTDGTIKAYNWSKISGPAGGSLTVPTVTVTGLQPGTYVYRLTVIDDDSAQVSDDVQIIVKGAQDSTGQITITAANDLWNITGKKRADLLFDNIITAGNKIDQEFYINNQFATPFVFFVSTGNSCYDRMSIQYYHGFGDANWTVTLYDTNRVQVGNYNFSGVYDSWATVQGKIDTIKRPIRYLRFSVTDPSVDTREIRLFGREVAKCSPVVPVTVPVQLPDPGRTFQGNSSIGGKDTNYMKLSNGLPIAGSFRATSNVFNWAHDETAAFEAQPFEIDKFGNFEKTTLSFHKRRGTPVMLYVNGANIKVIPSLKSTDSYTTLSQTNGYKDIPPGSDSTAYDPWTKNHARMWKALAHLYANNPASVLLPSYRIIAQPGTVVTPGQNNIKYYEIGNEDDKTWMGSAGFHSPIVMLQKLKAAWDSIKSVDVTAKVYLGALVSADTLQWKAMFFLNYWLYPGKAFPADGFCFNQYLSNAYTGQPQGSTADAVSPEQFQVTEKITAYRNFRDKYFPGRGLRWTEIGFAVGNSDYNVYAVPGFADTMVVANFQVRNLERAAVVNNGLEAVYNYFHTSDGTGVFGTMRLVKEKFEPLTGSYIGSIKLPLWWWYATRMTVLRDFNGWSTFITDGDSTGVTVTKYDHKTDPNKKVFYIVKGTYKGSTTSNYPVTIGSTAMTATLITMANNDEDGIQTNLPIANGVVIVPVVNEGPQYILINYGTLFTFHNNK